MTTRRQFLQTLAASGALLGAGGLLAACGSDSSSGATTGTGGGSGSSLPPATRLSMMEPFPLYLAFIGDVAAASGGYLAERGVDLDLQFAQGAPQALQQLLGGNVQLIRNAPLSMVRAVSQEGAPLVSIGTVNQELLYVLVSTKDAPIDSLDDIEGRTVGMATLGANAEDTFNLVLRAKGIDPEAVERQAVGNEAAALALVEEGRVDVIFSTREVAATMQQSGMEPHVAEVPGANPLLGTNLVTTRETLEKDRDALVGFLGGLHASLTALNDPGQLDDLLPKVRADWELPQLDDLTKVKPVIAAIAKMWFAAGADNLLRNVPERWAEGVAGFERLKIAKEGSDPTSFYTNDLLDEALS